MTSSCPLNAPGITRRSRGRCLSDLDRPNQSTAAELAHHWEAANDLPRAIAASVGAGRAAAAVYAFADAQRLFERALALWDRVADAELRAGMDRAALLELAATTSAAAGAFLRADLHVRAAIDLVDETEDPVRSGLLKERLARYAWDAGEPDQALAAVREAVRLVPADPPTAARARVLGGLARSLALAGSVDEATTTARDAVAFASATGARDVEADALVTLGVALGGVGAIRDSETALRRGRDMAIEIGDDYVALRAWWNLLATLDAASDENACATEGAAAAAWAEERGRTRSATPVMIYGAHALYELGRWVESDQMLRRLRLTTPEGVSSPWVEIALVHLEIGRGDLEPAARRFEAVRELGSSYLAGFLTVVNADLAARLALARGDLAEARTRAQPGVARLPGLELAEVSNGSHILVTALRLESEVAERARARGATTDLADATEHGRAIIEEARSVLGSIVTSYPEVAPGPAAVLALCEAEWSRLQGTSDAVLWSAAGAACADAEQLHLRPYALYRQAEAMLASRADRGEIAAVLREAHASVVAMGALPLRREIEGLAERARIRLDQTAGVPGDPGHGDELGLTPREREVLGLVAAGRTNRQIAAQLFIGEKTAGVHVSNILGKLGASGRTEAAAIAHRLGLVD